MYGKVCREGRGVKKCVWVRGEIRKDEGKGAWDVWRS